MFIHFHFPNFMLFFFVLTIVFYMKLMCDFKMVFFFRVVCRQAEADAERIGVGAV